MYKNVNCCTQCFCVLCCFLQYNVEYLTNFITIFFAHSYSSICYSIAYLFKLVGGTIYFVLQWSKSPIFLYFYTVFILIYYYYTILFKLLL